MNTNRAIKTTTALTAALLAAGVVSGDVKRLLGQLKQRIKTDGNDVEIEIRVYSDGWVANSARWNTSGTRHVVRCTAFGLCARAERYDRRRAYGRGPAATAFIKTAGQVQGRLAAQV